MCGENPETRMDRLVLKIDNNSSDFQDGDGEMRQLTATEAAELLECTPQVAGKVMACYWDTWDKKTMKGKVVYVPHDRGSRRTE